jgi:hypothetical protein
LIEHNGFYVAVGQQGSGKTAFITSLMVNEYNENNRLILSNYTLFNIPFIKIDLPSILLLIKSDELINEYKIKGVTIPIAKQYEEIMGKAPQSNNDYLNDSIILLDEVHIYFDAYDFLKKENRVISAFASQLRKRNTLLLATTQYLLKVSIRLRKESKFIFDLSKHDKLFTCDIKKIDGYYTDYLSTVTLDLRPYFKFYDTHELITP